MLRVRGVQDWLLGAFVTPAICNLSAVCGGAPAPVARRHSSPRRRRGSGGRCRSERRRRPTTGGRRGRRRSSGTGGRTSGCGRPASGSRRPSGGGGSTATRAAVSYCVTWLLCSVGCGKGVFHQDWLETEAGLGSTLWAIKTNQIQVNRFANSNVRKPSPNCQKSTTHFCFPFFF